MKKIIMTIGENVELYLKSTLECLESVGILF